MREPSLYETLNINVTHTTPGPEPTPIPAPTPVDPDIPVPRTGAPNTGFFENVSNFVHSMTPLGWCLVGLTLSLIIAGIVFFCLQRKFHRRAYTFLSAFFVATSLGLAVPAIHSVSNAIRATILHTTDFNIAAETTAKPFIIQSNLVTAPVDLPYGYTVVAYLDTTHEDDSLYNADGTNKIAAIPDPMTDPELFPDNTYGIQNSIDGTYLPIRNNSEIVVADTDTFVKAGTPLTITYAAKLDTNTPIDTYTGNIIYYITAKPMTLASLEARGADMQDDDVATACANTPVGDRQYNLKDKRDGQIYTIAKLADNKCWMTRNLNFSLDGTTLTQDDTNLVDVHEWTPKVTTVNDIESFKDELQIPQSLNLGNEYIYPSEDFEKDAVYSSLDECAQGGGHSKEECARYPSGILYNWTAAIASNDSSNYKDKGEISLNSICPKGWTLPGINNNEVGYMLANQGIIDITTSEYTTEGFFNVRHEPLNWMRTGYVAGHTRSNAGTSGGYWLNTADSSDRAFYTNFGNTHIYSGTNSRRDVGRAVRCVAY